MFLNENSYLSELLLFLLHQQGMFQLSRVVHVGHLEVTFEYLFIPVLMFRQSVFYFLIYVWLKKISLLLNVLVWWSVIWKKIFELYGGLLRTCKTDRAVSM